MPIHEVSLDKGEDAIKELLNVCHSHYIYGETQSQIADLMGVSKAKICKMIAKAKTLGLFSITVNDPIKAADELGERLVDRFGLRRAVVTPALCREPRSVISQLGQAAAALLCTLLRQTDVIGVSGGVALHETVNALPSVAVENTTVVPLLNGYNETEASTRGTEIAFTLARKIGASIANMPIPGLASSYEEARMFRENPIVMKSMSWIRKCNIGLFGIGTANRDASLYKGGFLDDNLLEDLGRENAVGCIGFSFYDSEGRPCSKFNAKNIGWTLEDIKQIPMSIGVSGGTLEKAMAVRGALLGRYIDILVTDTGTADFLLEKP